MKDVHSFLRHMRPFRRHVHPFSLHICIRTACICICSIGLSTLLPATHPFPPLFLFPWIRLHGSVSMDPSPCIHFHASVSMHLFSWIRYHATVSMHPFSCICFHESVSIECSVGKNRSEILPMIYVDHFCQL